MQYLAAFFIFFVAQVSVAADFLVSWDYSQNPQVPVEKFEVVCGTDTTNLVVMAEQAFGGSNSAQVSLPDDTLAYCAVAAVSQTGIRSVSQAVAVDGRIPSAPSNVRSIYINNNGVVNINMQ